MALTPVALFQLYAGGLEHVPLQLVRHLSRGADKSSARLGVMCRPGFGSVTLSFMLPATTLHLHDPEKPGERQ